MVRPPFWAWGSIMAWHSRRTSPRDIVSSESDSFPASMVARSRISLMAPPSKRRPEQIGVFAHRVGQSAIAIVELRPEFPRTLEG